MLGTKGGKGILVCTVNRMTGCVSGDDNLMESGSVWRGLEGRMGDGDGDKLLPQGRYGGARRKRMRTRSGVGSLGGDPDNENFR